jgi:iron complex outermembrane receptor protein
MGRMALRRALTVSGGVATAFLAALAGRAHAQNLAGAAPANPAPAAIMEGIVITAPRYVPNTDTAGTKTPTSLLETPQSVTVINRDQIDLLNEQNLGEAARYTAGVDGEIFGDDPRYDWLTVRGFYPVEYVDGLQAPVGSVSNIGVDLFGFDSV